MKAGSLWRLAVEASAETEDAISELLLHQFAQSPVSYTDAESSITTITVFLPRKPAWTPAAGAALSEQIRSLNRFGLHLGRVKLSLKRVPRQDWAESWKRHFKPLPIGRSLLIRPSWSRVRPRKGQAVLVLDPGLSFGTGQHPTTAFCLEQLAALRPRASAQSFLDLGTGSGILALAAARLGYAPVEALEFDPDAIRIAQRNARRNRLAARVRFRRADVLQLPRRPPRQFSVICANLTADLLLAAKGRIIAGLHRDGRLVLAGVLASEFGRVRTAYERGGLRLVASRRESEWRSGVFAFRNRADTAFHK